MEPTTRHRLWSIPVSFAVVLLSYSVAVTVLSDPPGDGSIFLAVGRGILNRRMPYVELFETKPPGIFYLAALAQVLGGAFPAQMFAATAIVVIFFSAAWKRGVIGIITGAVLATLSASFSPGFYPEVFGTAFLCVYARALLRPSAMGAFFIAPLCLFGAIFFKETFVLPAFAIALLMLRDVRSFAMLFVAPMFMAGLMFVATLGFLGMLRPYLTIYLPFMISVRVGEASNSGIVPFLISLLRFSPPFLFLLGSALWQQRSANEFMTDGAAVLLIVASALMGGFSPKHSAAAIAAYLAILMRGRPRPILVAATLFFIPLAGLPHMNSTWSQQPREAAAIDRIMDQCRFDRYFYLGNPSPLLALTKHSPQGPLFFLEYFMLQSGSLVSATLRTLDQSDIILFEKKRSALAIEKQFYDLTEQRVVRDFTLTPPPCAETFESDQFVLFYRRGLIMER